MSLCALCASFASLRLSFFGAWPGPLVGRVYYKRRRMPQSVSYHLPPRDLLSTPKTPRTSD